MIAMALSHEPRAAHRRRADDGPRRHDPGPDPGADEGAPGAEPDGDHAHHPRPRRRSPRWPTTSSSCTPARSSRRPTSRPSSSARTTRTRKGLLASIPRLGERRKRLEVIQGVVPNPLNLPAGLPLQAALPVRDAGLRHRRRRSRRSSPGHLSRCWLTPAGEPPAIGVEPTAEVAEEAAARPERRPMSGVEMETTQRPTRQAPPVDRAEAARPLLRGREPRQALRDPRRPPRGHARSAPSAPWTASRSTSGKGETLGLVGESGCGKTTLGKVILRLIPATSGKVMVKDRSSSTSRPRRAQGRPKPSTSAASMKTARRDLQVVFQDPYASLNPRMTVGEIVGEGPLVHGLTRQAASARTSSASCWPGSASTRATSTATRTSSAAASASGSGSPGRSPSTPSSSSATSRSRPSTCRSRARCSTCSTTSSRSSA